MISYNDLYDLLRKEKYNDVLQPLSKNFILEVAEYINERKVQSSKEDDLFTENAAKTKKQLENSISIFKELLRIRKKKILSLVFIATETGMMKRDYENMLSIEKETFDKLTKTFEECDKTITQSMNGKKSEIKDENKMILFNQEVEQFVDMSGNTIGPFSIGQLANLQEEVSNILVSSGKARFVDE